ncbi:MAG: molecular chaperone DnaJ [bacterium]|nr:molecular chaperone DnaJ [bacterium]
MADKRDYYEVLGVSKDADQGAIKKAYRKLAMQHHPDRNKGDKDAETKFKEAAEAYDVVGNGEKRAKYDRFGHQAFAGSAGQGGHPGGFNNMEDIFSAFGDIFGGGGGGGGFGSMFGGGGGRGRRPGGASKGRDLRIVLDLTLEEIAEGVAKTVSLGRTEKCSPCTGTGAKKGTKKTKCTTCGGQGQVARNAGIFTMAQTCPRCKGQGEMIESPCPECKGTGGVRDKADVKIQVPAGVEEGMRLVVRGEGDAGSAGGPRGDLQVVVRETEHKLFQRSGPDLLIEVPVSFSQLALGDKVEIPTLTGKVDMTIPTGTQSGKLFRLRNQGLPHLEGRGQGDQLVRVFVEVPKKLTDRQKELLAEFGDLEVENSGKKSFFDRILDHFA